MPKDYRVSKRSKGLQHDLRWKRFAKEQLRKEKKRVRRGLKPAEGKKLSKDPGVPNQYPYKAEVLRRLLEQKQEMTQGGMQRMVAQHMAQQLASAGTGDVNVNIVNAQNAQQNVAEPEFLQVIEKSDIIFEVLDARDPEGTRSMQAEESCQTKQKPFVVILNKVDLVSKDVVTSWLNYYKQQGIPIILFKSATDVKKGMVRYADFTDLRGAEVCVGGAFVKNLIAEFKKEAPKVVCGFIGHKNAGKSSVINSIVNRPACGSSQSIQEIHVDRRIRILDSPAIPRSETSSDVLCGENVENSFNEAQRLFSLVSNPMDAYIHYQLDAPKQTGTFDFSDFCQKLGQKLWKYAEDNSIDLVKTSAELINDWNRGSLPFWRLPSQHEHARQVVGAWEGIDAAMLDNFNADVLGHLVQVNGLHLK